jgi:magnesium-transporting ATPase (P-type)
VAECISEFKKAKIKVWMLTGDKEGTARVIGQRCGIIEGKVRAYNSEGGDETDNYNSNRPPLKSAAKDIEMAGVTSI